MNLETVIASVVGAVMAVLYFWIVVTLLRLDRELTKAEAENKKLYELGKSYLERAHAAEKQAELVRRQHEVADDYLNVMAEPPAANLTAEEYAAWSKSGKIPEERLGDVHWCYELDGDLHSGPQAKCEFCGSPDLGPQKSPSSVPAIEAQRRQLGAELDMGDLR